MPPTCCVGVMLQESMTKGSCGKRNYSTDRNTKKTKMNLTEGCARSRAFATTTTKVWSELKRNSCSERTERCRRRRGAVVDVMDGAARGRCRGIPVRRSWGDTCVVMGIPTQKPAEQTTTAARKRVQALVDRRRHRSTIAVMIVSTCTIYTCAQQPCYIVG